MDKRRGLALVTGASSGTGRETAKRLAEKGFEVIVAARHKERLEELASQYKSITPRELDLSEQAKVKAFCEYLSTLPGPVSVYKILYQKAGAGAGKLFMNATVPGPGPIADLILEAVLSENPRMVYSGGFLSQDILGKRFQLDDEGFHRFMGELTGLGDLRV